MNYPDKIIRGDGKRLVEYIKTFDSDDSDKYNEKKEVKKL